MGFGDFFVAALLGAVLAAEGCRYQDRAALITFGLAVAFDLLFIAIPVLPATVPVAIALLWVERRAKRRIPPDSATMLPEPEDTSTSIPPTGASDGTDPPESDPAHTPSYGVHPATG